LNYFCSGTANSADIQAATHYEFMVALQELGLRVNRPNIKVSDGIREVIDQCRRLREEKGNFPYPVEGALIQINSLDLQARLAHTSGNRRGMAAFKF
jgi:DNA ligase (NAD+)